MTVSESGPSVVLSYSSSAHTSTFGTGDSSAGVDAGRGPTTAPATGTPKPTSPATETTTPKETTPVSKSGADSSAPAPTAKKPKRSSLTTTALLSGGADTASAADSAAPSPPHAPPPTRPVVNEAAVQRGAPPPPASTAPTDSPQQAFVAPQAMPATASAPAAPASGVTGVVSNVLAWVGLASLASNSPTAPGESTALWAVCAWCRRQSQQTLADEAPSIDAKPTQTSLILADQSVAGEALALAAAMAVANAAAQPTALPTVGALDQATGAVSQPAGATPAASVQAIFSLVGRDTRQGPFPSNWFTVGDADQNTGLRVDLPLPDPAVSDYADISVINTLDGFNITPRISIPFNGEIDLKTVNSDTVFLQKLGSTLPNNGPGNARVGINQIVWDAATTTLHFTANDVLDQHTRYVLVVTTGVKDKNGNPIGSKAFKRFLDDQNFGQTGDPRLKDYHKELLDALAAVQKSGVKTKDVVVASVFTTRSVTTELEKIHEQIQAAPAPTVSDLQTFAARLRDRHHL